MRLRLRRRCRRVCVRASTELACHSSVSTKKLVARGDVSQLRCPAPVDVRPNLSIIPAHGHVFSHFVDFRSLRFCRAAFGTRPRARALRRRRLVVVFSWTAKLRLQPSVAAYSAFLFHPPVLRSRHTSYTSVSHCQEVSRGAARQRGDDGRHVATAGLWLSHWLAHYNFPLELVSISFKFKESLALN